MTILPYTNEDEYLASKNISAFMKENRIGELLKKSNAAKEQGVPALRVFGALLLSIFTGKGLHRLIAENSIGFSKDTVYRFLNSVKIQWQTFLSLLSALAISRIIPLTSEKRINTLLIDDTIYKRNRSKTVELLARVMDHTDGKYYKGFRCLTAAFSDGNTLIPTGFNVLSSQNKKSRLVEQNDEIDKRTNGYKRRIKAQISMFCASYDLIKQAQKAGIAFSHVLFDSWFAMPVMFRTLRSYHVHGLGMLKSTPTILYYIGKKAFTLRKLYDMVKHRIPNHKDTFSITVTLRGNGKDKDALRLKILFIHDTRAKNNWCALGTTDLGLSDEQMVVLYARRWDIEVFFKTCKEYLGFARDFQSRSYDAVCASVAIVFTRYILLAVTVRNNTDARTGGELFYIVYDEIRERSIAEALCLFWEYLLMSLQDFFALSTVQRFQMSFFGSLPRFLKDLLVVARCES